MDNWSGTWSEGYAQVRKGRIRKIAPANTKFVRLLRHRLRGKSSNESSESIRNHRRDCMPLEEARKEVAGLRFHVATQTFWQVGCEWVTLT